MMGLLGSSMVNVAYGSSDAFAIIFHDLDPVLKVTNLLHQQYNEHRISTRMKMD